MPGPAATTSTPSSVTCPSPVTWPAPPTARVTPRTPSAASSAARARRMRGVGTVALTGAMAKLGDARRLRLLGLVAREVEVVDGDVDLGHLQAGDALDALDDVLADRLGDLRNRLAVLDHHREVHGRLTLADFDCDALGAVFADAYALRHGPERALDAASQVVDAADLTRGDAGDLGHDGVRDAGRSAVGLQGVVPGVAAARDLSAARGARLLGHVGPRS